MSDTCPVCGHVYRYGPGARSHAVCADTMDRRAMLDHAVAWVMSDDPDKGPMPPLVERLRNEILAIGEDV